MRKKFFKLVSENTNKHRSVIENRNSFKRNRRTVMESRDGYNYLNAVLSDVEDYWADNKDMYKGLDRDELEEKLNDDLWIEDSVTGNGSGSYFFNRNKAFETVFSSLDNVDLLIDALEEFGSDEKEYKRVLTEPEIADVTIRLYCLSNAISRFCDELEKKGQFK